MADGLDCPEARGASQDQGSNLCLLYWRVEPFPLDHQGRPHTAGVPARLSLWASAALSQWVSMAAWEGGTTTGLISVLVLDIYQLVSSLWLQHVTQQHVTSRTRHLSHVPVLDASDF